MTRVALLIILAGLLTVQPLCVCSAESGPAAKPPPPMSIPSAGGRR